jgi:transcriptional regulator with XRE-family HTH domain
MLILTMSIPDDFESVRRRFAHNLRFWRHKRGMTQETLAAKAGVSRVYLARVETSVDTISLDNAAELARVLSIDIVDLLLP